ncbi:hypothetical protein AB4J90_05600 [Geobacillus thermodenitrificans]|jgi:fatty-acid desaturase|nr:MULTISPECIES: hypothetical protein [Geobacillus]MED3777967.1 hypothetical protein [Geobacillus stearothermophilus]MED4960229.1 hypothetical protein [Geobacillus stearothermophilus]MED4986426.1 hypothetical protein [Geobacillus stearothermophilus]
MIKRYVGYVVGLVIASIIIYFDAGIKQAVMSGGILLVSLIFWWLLSIMRKQKENNKVDEYIKLKIDRFVSRTFMFSIILLLVILLISNFFHLYAIRMDILVFYVVATIFIAFTGAGNIIKKSQ